MDALTDVASSISGSIHKAMLCVKRPAKEGEEKKSTTSLMEMRAKLVASSNTKVAKGVKTFAKAKASAGDEYHIMKVRYNPNKISFSTQAGNFIQSGPGGGGINQIMQISTPAQTSMQVELIFDDVNTKDAFMVDKLNISGGSAITAVAGIVKQARKKSNGYSIQTQVEGLIALITQSETRNAIFYWSNMAFAGEITNVNATYTMFNPMGNPVRGTVTLSIRQDETDGMDKKYWDDAFTRLFGKETEDAKVNAGKWTDKVGNLLNI